MSRKNMEDFVKKQAGQWKDDKKAKQKDRKTEKQKAKLTEKQTFYLDEETDRRLRIYCALEKKKRSHVINEAVKRYLANKDLPV